jgi:hypothetical protein
MNNQLLLSNMKSVTLTYDAHRIEVAVHEAGHSVISRVVRLPSGYTTIRDGNPRSWCLDDGDLRSILTCLAGRAATQVILGCADDHGCSIDDAKALRLLLADGLRSPWRARYMRNYLLDDSRLLIRQHRRAVEAVADALLERGTLSGAEIDQMMMDAEAWRRVTR